MPTQFHVCVTLGTRPEAIKLAPVIHLFRNNPQFQTSVILTGQHREMVEQVMRHQRLHHLVPQQLFHLVPG